LCISDINATTAMDYRFRLDDGYSLIHVFVHSWSQGHAFTVENGSRSDYFYNTDILPAHANANFYLLFACGNSRYIEPENCAAVYALQSTAGINTIGSTHSGGMLDYDYFYPVLDEGISYGEAFLKTLQHVGEGEFTESARSWYYGMTFNGDPFIVPQPHATTALYEAEKPITPKRMALSNYPNPFNPQTTVHYQLPETSPIKIAIFNALGRQVRLLVDDFQIAGYYEAEWDGKNDSGNFVGSGIYFCHIRTATSEQSIKMLLLR